VRVSVDGEESGRHGLPVFTELSSCCRCSYDEFM